MASLKDEIMARSGPEDALVAVELDFSTSAERTAGNDWMVTRSALPLEQLDYRDVAEQRRLTAQVVSSGPSGVILRDLMHQR